MPKMTEKKKAALIETSQLLGEMACESNAALTRSVFKDEADNPLMMLLYVEGVRETREILEAIQKVEATWDGEAAGFTVELPSNEDLLKIREYFGMPSTTNERKVSACLFAAGGVFLLLAGALPVGCLYITCSAMYLASIYIKR